MSKLDVFLGNMAEISFLFLMGLVFGKSLKQKGEEELNSGVRIMSTVGRDGVKRFTKKFGN